MDQRSKSQNEPARKLSADEKADRLRLIMLAAHEDRLRRREIRQEMLAAKRSMVGR